MNECIFIMLRHITKNCLNSEEIWKECYKSIRKFYKNKIIILDNNSDYSIVNNDLELENCEIINNPYYNTRLFAPFYHLLNIDFNKAIIIHDGVIFQKFVDFNNFKNVKFIWHFDIKQYDNIPHIKYQLNKLSNNIILHEILIKQEFTGCMGCCLAIEKDFLLKIEDIYKLSNLNNYINNQEDAIAFERTISIICFSLYPNLFNDLSFEGEIKYMVWGYRYHDFINKKTIFNQIEWDTQNEVLIDTTNKSIIKIFCGRK